MNIGDPIYCTRYAARFGILTTSFVTEDSFPVTLGVDYHETLEGATARVHAERAAAEARLRTRLDAILQMNQKCIEHLRDPATIAKSLEVSPMPPAFHRCQDAIGDDENPYRRPTS